MPEETKEADPIAKMNALYRWLLDNELQSRERRNTNSSTSMWLKQEVADMNEEVAEFQKWLKEIQSTRPGTVPINF